MLERCPPPKQKRLLEKVVEISKQKKNYAKTPIQPRTSHSNGVGTLELLIKSAARKALVVTSFQRSELPKNFYIMQTRSVLLEKMCL